MRLYPGSITKNFRTELKDLTRILVQASVKHGPLGNVWGPYSLIRFQDWLAIIKLVIPFYPWDIERSESGSGTSVGVDQRNKSNHNPELGRH